jgi:hypothetical protein
LLTLGEHASEESTTGNLATPDFQGWLGKKGKLNTSVKRRWFELRGSRLQYFEQPVQKGSRVARMMKGEIQLLSAECTQIRPSEESGAPQIEILMTGRVYRLLCENRDERRQWLEELHRARSGIRKQGIETLPPEWLEEESGPNTAQGTDLEEESGPTSAGIGATDWGNLLSSDEDEEEGAKVVVPQQVEETAGSPKWQPVAVASTSQERETRVDSEDGNGYTRSEFIEQYGGTVEWDAAAPTTLTTQQMPEGVPPAGLEMFGAQSTKPNVGIIDIEVAPHVSIFDVKTQLATAPKPELAREGGAYVSIFDVDPELTTTPEPEAESEPEPHGSVDSVEAAPELEEGGAHVSTFVQ